VADVADHVGGDVRLLDAILREHMLDRQCARRRAWLRLIVADGDTDYYVTRALQVLQEDLARDSPYLAKQGCAPRSLAAIAWANTDDTDPQIGDLLARAPDPRVRRERADAARDRLRGDSRHSVRRLLPALSGSVTPAEG